MDWIHCNKCFVTPSAGGQQFWFSGCGHVVCWNCLKSPSTPSVANIKEPQTRPCVVCQKPTQHIEVNSKMRPEVLAFFRQPKDLLAEYAQRVKQVMEFQNYQAKHLQERNLKYVQYAKTEVQRCKEKEKMALLERGNLELERNNLKLELDRSKETRRLLEKSLHNAKREIQHMLQQRDSATRMTVFPAASSSSSSALANRSFHHNTPATVAGYPISAGGGNHRGGASFMSASNSFYGGGNHSHTMSSIKTSTPLLPGRITKGPVLPHSLDMEIRRRDRNDTNTCDHSTDNNFHMRQHRLIQHLGLKPWVCAICGDRFSFKNDLRYHLTSLKHLVSPEDAEQMLDTEAIEAETAMAAASEDPPRWAVRSSRAELDVTEVPAPKKKPKKKVDGRRIHFGAGPVYDDDGRMTMMAAKEFDGKGRLFKSKRR